MDKAFIDIVEVDDVILTQYFDNSTDTVLFETRPDEKLMFSITPNLVVYHHLITDEMVPMGALTGVYGKGITFVFDSKFLAANIEIKDLSIEFNTKDYILAEYRLMEELIVRYPWLFKTDTVTRTI